MQKHLFLTSPSGCGKSEAIRRALGPSLLGAGGFVTAHERDRDGKLQRSLLLPAASAGGAEGFEALPYLDLRGTAPLHDNEVFRGEGVRLLLEAAWYPFSVLDAIGGFELLIPQFRAALADTLSSEQPLLGVLMQQNEAAALCRRNLEENGLDAGGILCGDLREHRALLKAGAYDLVVSNPPYFAEGSGYAAPDPARAAARDERTCSLDALCAAAGYLCRWGGAFALVHRPERLAEVFAALQKYGLEPKHLRFVQYNAERAPSLALIEARRGGKPGLTVCAPLLLTGPDGGDSEEIREIYHMG